MKKHIFLFFTALLVLFSILYGLQMQEKLSMPLEHVVTVELVVVEVFVTDKKGNFVDNLTKDDFEIYEDGKKVEIQYFALETPEKKISRREISEKTMEKKIPERPQEMKLVILFDNINTNRFYLNSNWPQIEKMFQALSGKVKETMIMELNRESGAKVIKPFTSDQKKLINEINKFKIDKWKEIEREIRKIELEELGKEARLPLEDRIIGNPEYLRWCLGEEERMMRRRELSDSFSAFLAAINYIRRFEGIKSVLLVSDGFHLGGGFVKIFDPFELFGGKKYFDQREAFEEFLKLINEERFIFYAFSPMPSTKRFLNTEQWANELYSLEKISEETGGMFLRGEKKYENFVKELGRDLTHFYDISYTPPIEKRKPGFHRIEVKVKKPGLVVRHKKGYSDLDEEVRERKNILSAFLSPSYYKDIALSCKCDFIPSGEGYSRFWIRMMIPLEQFRNLRDISTPEKLTMIFGISEWAEKRVHFGEIEIPLKDAIAKDIPSIYYAFLTSGVKLKPREYDTRVILEHSVDQIAGWQTSLKIPDMNKEPPLSIINSIFCYFSKEKKVKRVPFSFSKKDGCLLLSHYRLYPSVGNVFRKKDDVALYLQVYDPKETPDFSLKFILCEDEGVTLNLPSQKIESHFDKKSKILNEAYILDFQDIPAGSYKLKVESSDSRTQKELEIKIIS